MPAKSLTPPLGLDPLVVDRIRAVFDAFPGVEEAVVYGSRAKGTQKNGSDIDIAVKGTGLSLHDLHKVSDALDDLLLPYTFDLALWHQIDNQDLIAHIGRVGKVIFRRDT